MEVQTAATEAREEAAVEMVTDIELIEMTVRATEDVLDPPETTGTTVHDLVEKMMSAAPAQNANAQQAPRKMARANLQMFSLLRMSAIGERSSYNSSQLASAPKTSSNSSRRLVL